MDQSRRSEDKAVESQVAKGTVARVRVSVLTTHEPTEIASNDTLSLIWQAFCVLEGSPKGLDVIDHRTRCIRAPLLKRFCRFLENNAIDMHHATAVERLLQREAPHMNWRPVVPEMLAADIDVSKREPKPPVAETNVVGRNPNPNTTALCSSRTSDNLVERARGHTGQRENPIVLIDTQDGINDNQGHSRKVANEEQSKKKPALSWAEARPESGPDTRRPFDQAGEARKDEDQNMDVVARRSSNESRQKAPRKGGMVLDHSHVKLLGAKAPTKSKAAKLVKRGNSAFSPCDSYSVPIPTEAELRGDDLHAWPLLGKDLRFIFQPTLWPAFCKTENFRLPQCFLPGFGFGLIDSSTNTIRIALVLRFFRFLKRKEGQATMVRALRALNKLLLTESLSRGLDWEMIALEKVKPLLKIIGNSSLENAVPEPPPAPTAAYQEEKTTNTGSTRNQQSGLDSNLAMNRKLASTETHSTDTSQQAASDRAQMQLLQVQQKFWQNNGKESNNGVRPSKSDQLIRTNQGPGDQEVDPLNRDRSPSPRGREDASKQSDIKSKCINVLDSVEDLINAMEAEHATRSLHNPLHRQSEINTDEQHQYKMVAASLEDLTKKASRLLDDGDTDSEPNPMANTLIMLKSSVEALSSKLDAVSESLQSQSNRGEAPAPSLDLPRSYSSTNPLWSSFDHDSHSQPDRGTNISVVDMDSARKRAILSHAAAERDRLKRQRMG